MNKKHSRTMNSPKNEHSEPALNQKRGEKPRLEKEQFTGDAIEQEAILSDDDESSINAMKKTAQDAGDTDESESYHDPAGMVGPVHSHIEADNLSDEFLSGEVDLVQQMEKTVDAIQDAYEGEGYDQSQRV